MVELRLDGVADLDVAGALAGPARPVIVTCRPTWEGGRFDGSEDERRASVAGARAGRGVCGRRVARPASNADFAASCAAMPRASCSRRTISTACRGPRRPRPRDARRRRRGRSRSRSAATRLSDTLPLLEIAPRGRRRRRSAWATPGVPSRLLAARFGSRWTYAGNAVAPGQIPAATMVDEFRFRSRRSRTRGSSASSSTNAMHSLSPVMHNAAFAAAGIDAVYVPLRAADFDDFLTFAAAHGHRGRERHDSVQARRAQRGERRPIG